MSASHSRPRTCSPERTRESNGVLSPDLSGRINVFFDVQGTLVCSSTPRPHVREVFAKLADAGHDIHLWSSVEAGYAFSTAALLGVEDVVFRCYSKFAPPPVTVGYAADAHPDVVDPYGGYIIAPFDDDLEDRELWKVAERLE